MKILYNSMFLKHSSEGHPESPGRLSFFQHLKDSRIINGEIYLGLGHSQEHVEKVLEAARSGQSLSSDTFVSPESFEVACYAVGAAVQAAEKRQFALVRPPGHHASFDKSEGFCLFNNIAIAAKYMLNKGKKVFVFDFDLHHGNGTQDILAREKNARYFSIHQAGAFPGTGLQSAGNSTNIALRPGARDVEYISLLERKLAPALKEFNPDVVAVSAGFDCYYKDFGLLEKESGFNLTKRAFEKIRQVLEPYNHFMVLEGGYNPESVFEGVSVFAGE